MLRVSYLNPMGYVLMPVLGTTKKCKCDICQANVKLWAEIHHCTDNEGKLVHQLMGFYMDNAHLERCLKSMPTMLEGYEYHLNSYYKNWSAQTLRLLCRMGASIIIYYEEPKEPCQK